MKELNNTYQRSLQECETNLKRLKALIFVWSFVNTFKKTNDYEKTMIKLHDMLENEEYTKKILIELLEDSIINKE